MSMSTVRAYALSTALCLVFASPALAQNEANSPAASGQCSADAAPDLPDRTPVSAEPGTTTIDAPLGEIDIPTAPQAALGMYTTDVDILIWLGFPLAERQPIRGDSGYTTFPCFFPAAPLAGIKTFGNYPDYNFEAILAAEPDFILNGLGYDDTVNQRLPQIAPTYSVNAFDGRFWQDHFRETAAALGRLDRYDLWLDVYQTRLAEVKAAISANADAVVAPLGYWNGIFNSGCYVGVQCAVFRDLGLTIFEGALENDGEGHEYSPEELAQLADIDYAFTMTGVGEAGLAAHADLMAAAERNPLWTRLDFVVNDHIIPFEMEIVYGSPSGQLAFLDVVEKALSR